MELTITDERQGCTSASSAEADSLCPGRHLAQRGLADGEKSADADSGNRIHAWLESERCFDPVLTDEQMQTAEKCRAIEAAVVAKIFGEQAPWARRELRIWSDFGGFKHSGKPDVVYVFGKIGLVIDYKTGRNEVAESSRNLQLRDLAVLAAIEYALDKVYVVPIQPWATMTPEPCEYDKAALIFALGEMEARIVASNAPNSQSIPGNKQCQYCKAKATCAEFMAASLPESAAQPIPEPAIIAGIQGLDGNRLGKFLALVRLADDTATAEVRRRIEAGEAVEGWTLKAGLETEKITDAQTVFTRALAAGITQYEFVAECITVGKTALKTALKTATGAKGKALDVKLEEMLEGVTETKMSQPVLTKN
jgi:hypothetical protein